MSMQAQAERERQARVILGDSERQVAKKFGEAARTYAETRSPSYLRAMNMLYEGLKRRTHYRYRAVDCGRNDAVGGAPTLATIASAIGHANAPRDAAAGPSE